MGFKQNERVRREVRYIIYFVDETDDKKNILNPV